MTVPEVGTEVGAFQAINQYGQEVTLGQDTWWLLFFYPYAFTGICSGELRTLRDHRTRFEDLGCKVAAVSCDTMFALRVFADTEGFGCNLISDHWPHGEISRRFGVFDEEKGCAIRGSFLLDPSGTVRWTTIHGMGDPRDIGGHLEALRGLVA